ncbi:MAG: sugar phosphate isomerase/epimerase family protein [Phycisphaerae bacterium]
MKKAICQYSLHRRYVEEKWTMDRFADEVKALGVEGIDFLAHLIQPPDDAAERINAVMARGGLALSGLSLSSDFNQADKAKWQAQVDGLVRWFDVAVKVKSPVCRIFGGHLPADQRKDLAARKAAWGRMLDGVAAATKEAAKRGVLLAIENHGGLPCTGEEQVEVIKSVNSPFLKATIDVGNYMGCGQEGHVGTAIAAPYAAYVHFKDNIKVPDPASPWGWKPRACVVGEGAVDLAACVAALKTAGYDGFLGLEYEGPEPEVTGVPRSVETLKRLAR